MKKKISLFIFTLLVLSVFVPRPSHAASPVIGGKNRVETAILISQAKEHDNIILVNSTSFADAASSVNLSAKEKASILLNPEGPLLKENLEEIKRVNPAKVFILGGESAISSQAEEEIQASGFETLRFSGKDRYETNRQVVEYVFADQETIAETVLVNGHAFSDLISIGAYVYHNNIPLILSDYDGTVIDSYAFLDKTPRFVLVGGKAVLSPDLLNKRNGSYRVSGSDRYETSALIHKHFFPKSGKMYVTTGEVFSDALVAVSLLEEGQNIRLARHSVKEIEYNSLYSITRLGKRLRDGNGIAIYINPHQDDETLTMGLQLIRDAKEGKEIYLLQMTRGWNSSVLKPVNRKLKSAGLKPLEYDDIPKARDNEVMGVLSVLGVPKEAFVICNPKGNLTPEFVTDSLDRFTARFHDSDIALRTMALNPPGKAYDYSAGGSAHRACSYGVEHFTQKVGSNGNRITAKYFLGARTDEEIPGFIKTVASQEEAPIYDRMLDQYGVWDPKEGRYQIGFLSVGHEFIMKKTNMNMYEQE